MIENNTIFIIAAVIIFFSTFVRSSIGFGNAVIAMPLLAITAGMKIATPLVAIISFIISLIIFIQQWRIVDFKSAWKLILSSALGVPLGLLILKHADETIIKIILAVLIITFCVYNLIQPKLIKVKNDNFAFLFGFIAGIIGGAYNTNGPPIAVYGTLRDWKPDVFRATMQGYFIPVGICIIIGHGISGYWTFDLLKLLLFTLPSTILGTILGSIINKRIPKEKFKTIVYIFLIIIGFLLLYNSLDRVFCLTDNIYSFCIFIWNKLTFNN